MARWFFHLRRRHRERKFQLNLLVTVRTLFSLPQIFRQQSREERRGPVEYLGEFVILCHRRTLMSTWSCIPLAKQEFETLRSCSEM